MPVRRDSRFRGFCASLLVLATVAIIGCVRPASAQAVAADVPLESGSERVLFAGPSNPGAILIMLPGGDGIVEIGNTAAGGRLANNFLIRTQQLWLGQGFAVEILGSPQNASLLGQRHTPAYAAAIDRAIDFARTRANAPVWLVGTSQGSTAAANGAARLGGKVAGVILTSSVTRQSQSGETVFDANPGAIAVPALILANQGDTCAASPPTDAAVLAGYLTRSPRKDLILVQSSDIRSPPCEAMSPHGFLGIEPQVVQRVAEWIR
jgi:pimeloyl-ACP methyl ester carboxylesterase